MSCFCWTLDVESILIETCDGWFFSRLIKSRKQELLIMSKFNRRQFVKGAASTATTFSLFTIGGTKSSRQVLGANDRIRIGVAGINGRGTSHIGGFAPMDVFEVSCLIDPD